MISMNSRARGQVERQGQASQSDSERHTLPPRIPTYHHLVTANTWVTLGCVHVHQGTHMYGRAGSALCTCDNNVLSLVSERVRVSC